MADDPFRRDFDPRTGQAVEIAPGVRRITAPNASPMTFTGTNTYLVGEADIAVIDPGPDNEAHFQAILAAVGAAARISHVFVTHSHVDHSPLARRLSKVADAPILALGDSFSHRTSRMESLARLADLGGGEGVDAAFTPDILVKDGETVQGDEWQLSAVSTPGHFSNHVCFALQDMVFSGDHVMGWATTLVSPPDGDLTAFMQSLRKMSTRDDRVYFPGHGGMVDDPHGMVAHQIGHRNRRESQIMAALGDGPATALALAQRIYTEIPPELIPAAARNVFSHLLDLEERNLAAALGALTHTTLFAPKEK